MQNLRIDPRYFQAGFQALFLGFGILALQWQPEPLHYLFSIGTCVGCSIAAESVRHRKWPARPQLHGAVLSSLISALSLCLLLKTGSIGTSMFAAAASILSKYLFRVGHKHLFNPSAFGIVAALLFTGDAWLSPGQWGSGAVIAFGALTLGTIVVTRVQKLDISLAFLVSFIALLYWRQVYTLGWPTDHFFHSVTTGSLLLFSFFMISDPRTAPDHPVARIAWALLIAGVSFYLAAFKFQYNTPIWVLVAAAPMVPILDKLFKGHAFTWQPTILPIHSPIKKLFMKTTFKKTAALCCMALLFAPELYAFCGIYVSKADGTLKNKTSQVIMVRDGNRNVITMYNDFKGDYKDFAMVVPVPVVLQEKDIKVVDAAIFQTLNDYSKPRLVEYYDDNPCERRMYYEDAMSKSSAMAPMVGGVRKAKEKELGVKVEAKYIIGEYDILILSAKESAGLKTWLTENGYKIPAAAEEVLQPYIKSNLKFFVVKVNEKQLKKLNNAFLRPIQIRFDSPKFMLPIRLGMANGDGDQDLLVYAFTKQGRVETTNYRTVALPTGNKVPLFVKDNFSAFYSNLFGKQWQAAGKSVAMLEYAWDVSPQNFMKCDPCVATAPSVQDLVQSGVWWVGKNWKDYSDADDAISYSSNVHFTRLHFRYNRASFPQDLQFVVTPNKENYQARYVITHPATGNLDCDMGKAYLLQLKDRRKEELRNLRALTGKTLSDWDLAALNTEQLPKGVSYQVAALGMQGERAPVRTYTLAGFGCSGFLLLLFLRNRKRNGEHAQ